MNLHLSRKIALLIGCLILVISVGLGYTALRFSTDSVLNLTKDTLIMSAEEGIKLFEANMSCDLNILQEVANRARTQTMDWDTQRDSLIYDVSRLNYTEMGIVTPDGTARFLSDKVEAVGDEDYIKKAFQGDASFSDIIVDKVTNQPIIMIAAPIKADNRVVGLLIAKKPSTFLSYIIRDMGFGENGYAFIIDEEGTILAHKNIDYVMERRSIFKDIETGGDLKNAGLAFKELGIGNKGLVNYDLLGSKRYMGAVPIPDTNWTIAIGALESDVLGGLSALKISILIGTGVFLLIGLIIAMAMGKSISKPITEYSKVIDKFANYDLRFDENSGALKYLKRKDEIGAIGNSLVTMQKNLVMLISKISETSQHVASSSEELTATSEQSATAAEEVARAIDDMAKGAGDQAKDTENGAVSIEGLANLIEESMKAIVKLNVTVDEVARLKNEGLDIIEDLVDKTKKSGEAAGGIYEIIVNTDKSAEEIENASDMIKSIAEQTNLLALNAAIEAARAGEAGRGFAVVAQEIRKLAEESNKFTEEISKIISELLEKTDSAVKTMGEVGEIVKSQTNSVSMSNEKFQGIADLIEEIKTLLENINKSEEEMVGKKDEVIKVMENLSAISEENAAGSEEASASVEEQTAAVQEIANASEALAQLASEMQEAIIKFKH